MWILDKILDDNCRSDAQIFVMYDVACMLFSHLQVFLTLHNVCLS